MEVYNYNGQVSFGDHHADEFLELDVAIIIGLTDQLIDFFIDELVTKVGDDVMLLSVGDSTFAILIEDHEILNMLFFCVCVYVLHLARHER